jgi:hypothetical protein
MNTYGEVDVEIHAFLTSALVGDEWSASRPSRFTPWDRVTGTHYIGGWVGPRTGLDDVQKRKNLAPAETGTPTPPPSNPVASRCTDLNDATPILSLILCSMYVYIRKIYNAQHLWMRRETGTCLSQINFV